MTDPVLREAAEWYYEVAELYEDDDLDPEDTLEVIRRAFNSSDCDDFAWMLSQITGWPTVMATWQIPDWGFGHHSLVRAPDGRLLDVAGWTDANELTDRYCRGKANVTVLDKSVQPGSPDFEDTDEHGLQPIAVRIASVIRRLPYGPFNEAWFTEMSGKPIEGVDHAADAPRL